MSDERSADIQAGKDSADDLLAGLFGHLSLRRVTQAATTGHGRDGLPANDGRRAGVDIALSFISAHLENPTGNLVPNGFFAVGGDLPGQ